MKKSLLLIFLSIFSFATIHAKITWTLSDDGTLTISGTDMTNNGTFPWDSQRDKIKKVIIKSKIFNTSHRVRESDRGETRAFRGKLHLQSTSRN